MARAWFFPNKRNKPGYNDQIDSKSDPPQRKQISGYIIQAKLIYDHPSRVVNKTNRPEKSRFGFFLYLNYVVEHSTKCEPESLHW